jgi:hypothetical protein
MIHLLIIHVLDMYLVSRKPVECGLDALDSSMETPMFYFFTMTLSPCNHNCTNEILITKNSQTMDHSCVSSGETASSLHTMHQ